LKGPAAGNKVQLEFWFSSSDTRQTVYPFLAELNKLIAGTPEIEFTPHYVTWYCSKCRANNWRTPEVNCLSGGRYCAPDPGTTKFCN